MASADKPTTTKSGSFQSWLTLAACSVTGYCSYNLYQKQQREKTLQTQYNALQHELESAQTQKAKLETLYHSLCGQHGSMEEKMSEIKESHHESFSKYKECAEAEITQLKCSLDEINSKKQEHEEILNRLISTLNTITVDGTESTESGHSMDSSQSTKHCIDQRIVDRLDLFIQGYLDTVNRYKSLSTDHDEVCSKLDDLSEVVTRCKEEQHRLDADKKRSENALKSEREKVAALNAEIYRMETRTLRGMEKKYNECNEENNRLKGELEKIQNEFRTLTQREKVERNLILNLRQKLKAKTQEVERLTELKMQSKEEVVDKPVAMELNECNVTPDIQPQRQPLRSPTILDIGGRPSSPDTHDTDAHELESGDSNSMIDPLTTDLNIKRAMKWTHAEQKWTKVCRSGTLRVVQDDESGEKMVVIKKRTSGDEVLHFKHVLPPMDDAHFKSNEVKLSCQWSVQSDVIQNDEDLTVFVYFRTRQAFKGFVHCFENLS